MTTLSETSFHLYSDKEPSKLLFSPSSSIFDMISSSERNLEPKQTKALAYMLSYSRPLAKAFCSLVSKLNTTKIRCRVGKCDRLSVFAESSFQNKRQRADIVLLNRDERDKEKWAIVVEAKSWNRIVSDFGNVDGQVKQYCDAIQKEWKLSCIVPVLLIQPGSGLASATSTVLSWDDIRSIVDNLKSSDRLMKEFKAFLAGDKKMKSFVNEVLTVPTGETYEFVKRHFVYTCPPPKKTKGNNYDYKPFLYLAIREHRGGRMEWLFKVVRRYLLPKSMEDISKMQIDHSDMEQIRSYWTDPEVVRFAQDKYSKFDHIQFFVLDKDRSIKLRTPMKPKGRNCRGIMNCGLFDFFGDSDDQKLVYTP